MPKPTVILLTTLLLLATTPQVCTAAAVRPTQDGPLTPTAVTASSETSPAEGAIDDDLTTGWRADAGRQWLRVDLGGQYGIRQVRQTFAENAVWKFLISVSQDGTTWTTVVDGSAGRAGRTFADGTTGTARYVQLDVLESANPASSLDFTVVGSVPQVPLAGTASASSAKAGYEPADALDTNTSSYWVADNGSLPHSLLVDLGEVRRLTAVEQNFKDFDTWRFRIEASPDKATWTTLVDHGSGVRGQSFHVEASGEYRYVQLTITGSASGFWANSTTFRVLGPGQSPPRPVAAKWWEERSGVARFFPVWQGIRLDDITAQLDTLKAQGHSAIELTPIFQGVRDLWAGLGVTDLYAIHPEVGTFEDLAELLDAAHARDMKILFFANPGYAHESAPFFQKALRDYANGVDSPERCWFDIRPEPGEHDRWVYNAEYDAYYWALWDDRAPSFHFAKPCWRDEVNNYVRFWMDKGFDGIIFDAPNVYHQTTVAYNNEAITDVTAEYDTFVNAEGVRGREYVTDWHYNSLQDYTITQWQVPEDGPGSSRILDAIDSGNPDALDGILKGYRDEVVEAGGITQTPPNWGRRNYPVDRRLLEIATLTTMGTLFYVHNDFYTINPIEQEFPNWPPEQVARFHQLMKAQNSDDALSPVGLRVKLATNDDQRFYAYLRSNRDGSVKALVVLNFQSSIQDITVDLSNLGINTDQTPLDLVSDAPAPPITSTDYSITLPGYGAAILAVT